MLVSFLVGGFRFIFCLCVLKSLKLSRCLDSPSLCVCFVFFFPTDWFRDVCSNYSEILIASRSERRPPETALTALPPLLEDLLPMR